MRLGKKVVEHPEWMFAIAGPMKGQLMGFSEEPFGRL
jgi:hypothetical protein